MADKVLPQRVSVTSAQGTELSCCRDGGPCNGKISLSSLLPTGNFCSIPNHPGMFLSLPLAWQERVGVRLDSEQARSRNGVGWRSQEVPKNPS